MMRKLVLTPTQHHHLLELAVDELNCAIKHKAVETRVERLREIVSIIDNAEEVEVKEVH
jgi:hypothetical protein